MFNKVLIITILLVLGGCGGIRSLPSLPSMEPTVAPVACVREGDGFLSFTYEEGHLAALTLKQTDEKITLSKGVTIIQKVPLGRYSTIVTGYQKEPTKLQSVLECDGETKAYVLRLDLPSSLDDKVDVMPERLRHSIGKLVVGSVLNDFSVRLTKLDAPFLVFEDPSCSEDCPPVDNQVFLGATEIKLPEGEYLIKSSSGGGQTTYIDASSYTAIEVTVDGIEITSQEIVVPEPTQQVLEPITNRAGLLKGFLQ